MVVYQPSDVLPCQTATMRKSGLCVVLCVVLGSHRQMATFHNRHRYVRKEKVKLCPDDV